MNQEKKAAVGAYYRWPFLAGLIPAAGAAAGFAFSVRLGLIMTGLTAVYYIAALIIYLTGRKNYLNKLTEFGASFAHLQNQLFRETKIPFALTAPGGKVLWSNQSFKDKLGLLKKEPMIHEIFPELENANFRQVREYHLTLGDMKFALYADTLDAEDAEEVSALTGGHMNHIYGVYLIDETELLDTKQTLEEEKNVAALIYLDNYEEVMESVEEVRKSLLSALLERKLNKYAASVHGAIRKLEKDRFMMFMRQKDLWTLEADGFSLLEDIKTVSIGNEAAVTVSIGVGLGGGDVETNFSYARASVEMALSRGGDQAVVKEGEDIRYYGGKTKSTERNTRVRARMMAQNLQEQIRDAGRILIMGHPMADLDCFGAAFGIYRLAKTDGKKAQIVTGTISASVRPLMSLFRDNAEYGDDLFIESDTALKEIAADTLLVIVDTNRPSYTECPELISRAIRIAVIDHHRQGKERITNAQLSYVEPFASSASEMVAELVQYYGKNGGKLLSLEADALLSGIVMDTNNFVDKAGVRTFEAAAYLRRSGADVTRVRKLFRENMEDYRLRADTIRRAEIFRKNYVISVCPSQTDNRNQTVVAAQAANELLEIEGIRASFVLTEFEGKVYLSARSIDDCNVQVLMEKMGGGGHMSVAGAQFTDKSVDEIIGELKKIITESEDK